jgi:DNA invertase Pin-like site-specific DNA recombinase
VGPVSIESGQTAIAHNLEIWRWCEVVESGTTAFRSEDFRQVFADLARPDIAGAIVASIDRLVRPNFLGDLQALDPFQRLGKLLFTPTQVIDFRSESDWLTTGIFGLNAGLERRAIARRTAGAKERMRSAGRHPGGDLLLPHGLDYVRERDEHARVVRAYWKYNEEESKRVLLGYDMLFSGASYEDMGRACGLTGRGIVGLLRNSVWKGVRTFPPNGLRAVPLEMPLGIEPLISPERWAAAQKVMDDKCTATRARKRPHGDDISLALGLLRCHCGRFHYLQRDPRPGQHDLFYCASRRPGPSCGAPTLRRADVEPAVVRTITKHFSDRRQLFSLLEAACSRDAKPARDPSKIERELARCAAERQRLIDLCVRGLITADEFEQRARKLESVAHDLEATLPKAESLTDHRAVAAATVSLLVEFAYLSPSDQHALARSCFIAFDVADDGRAIAGAVMRDAALQDHMKNGTRLTPSSSGDCRGTFSRSVRAACGAGPCIC